MESSRIIFAASARREDRGFRSRSLFSRVCKSLLVPHKIFLHKDLAAANLSIREVRGKRFVKRTPTSFLQSAKPLSV